MPIPSEAARPGGPESDSTSRQAMRAAVERALGEASGETARDGPPEIPDHELLGRIGRGAYGEVWLARSALGTLRAVKIIYRAQFEDAHPYEREFKGILRYEPISRSHEGLVQVLHVGRNDAAGCFYYVMELADDSNSVHSPQSSELRPHSTAQSPKAKVQSLRSPQAEGDDGGQGESDGGQRTPGAEKYRPRTLRADLRRHERLAPAEAAQLAVRVANALAHLHSHGLVHRDVKPSNVIFVRGQPKLADIGLVADTGDSRSFVGTEGFIPPEGPGSAQADLYALGKLLYELATGRDRLEFPQLPPDLARLEQKEALLDLNEVITRACAPQPRERYATATALEADLNLFLAGRSLREAHKVQRNLVRLRRLVSLSSIFLLLAIPAVWVAKNAEHRATLRAQVESALRQRAEAAERDSRQQLYSALSEQARATVRSRELGQRVRALAAVGRAAAISNATELRGEALAALGLPDLRLERELPTGVGVTMAQLDPKFTRLAVVRGRGPVEILTVPDMRLVATLPGSANLPVYGAFWSLDGRFLAVKRDHSSTGERADLELWDVAKQNRVLLLRDVPWGAICFHPRLARILVSGQPNGVVYWDLETGKEIARWPLAGDPAVRLLIAPEGDRFAALQTEPPSCLFSLNRLDDGARLFTHTFEYGVGLMSWHPAGKWIAVPDWAGAVHLLEPQTGAVRTLGRHKLQATQTIFSPDGDYLFSGGWEREVICWDLRTLERAFVVGLDAFVVQFRDDSRECAIVTAAGLQVHAFEKPRLHWDLSAELGGRLGQAAFSPDGRWLAAAGGDNVCVWDLATPGPANVIECGDALPVFSASGDLFARNQQGCLRWRIGLATNSGAPPLLEPVESSELTSLRSICVWSNQIIMTGPRGSRMVGSEDMGTNAPWALTVSGLNGVSPDGRWLAIYAPFSPWLHVYRLPQLEYVVTLTNHANIREFAFSPHGDELAVTSSRQAEFWSTATWQRTRGPVPFIGVLYPSAGRGLWLTKDFRTGGLYDGRTLEPLLPLPAGTLPLALSPDGHRLAVSVDAQHLQVWDLVEVREELRKLGLDWPE